MKVCLDAILFVCRFCALAIKLIALLFCFFPFSGGCWLLQCTLCKYIWLQEKTKQIICTFVSWYAEAHLITVNSFVMWLCPAVNGKSAFVCFWMTSLINASWNVLFKLNILLCCCHCWQMSNCIIILFVCFWGVFFIVKLFYMIPWSRQCIDIMLWTLKAVQM